MDLEQEIYEFMSMSERAYGNIYPEAIKAIRTYIVEALKPSHNTARDEIPPDACPDCHGCGNVEISHVNQCYRCHGTGKTSPIA